MAADLSIHAFTDDLTEADVRAFFANTLGSPYFNLEEYDWARWDAAFDKISATPSVWIGEVSWLKAVLTGDDGTFIPSTVHAVQEAIGWAWPVLDATLTNRILAAFEARNETGYELADPAEVAAWLQAHQGARVFTVSW